jgi:FtsP/CotA-like multicopper oxidase with cupredoxin domain
VRWAPTELAATTPATQAYFPFDPNSSGQGYVWHCHIVDHEDNEMMRPDEVEPNPNAVRTFVKGTDF